VNASGGLPGVPAFHYWNGVLPRRKYYNAIALSRIFFLRALRFDRPMPTFFIES
jgi:hypothetical protein